MCQVFSCTGLFLPPQICEPGGQGKYPQPLKVEIMIQRDSSWLVQGHTAGESGAGILMENLCLNLELALSCLSPTQGKKNVLGTLLSFNWQHWLHLLNDRLKLHTREGQIRREGGCRWYPTDLRWNPHHRSLLCSPWRISPALYSIFRGTSPQTCFSSSSFSHSMF